MASDLESREVPEALDPSNQHIPISQESDLPVLPPLPPRWAGTFAKAEPTGDWPESRTAFKDGWLRQHQAALWSYWPRLKHRIHLKLHGKERGNTCIVTMQFNKIIKFGKHIHLSEAWALQLVATKTIVPVPKVFSAYKKDGIAYIVMDKVKGDPMNEVWQDMPEEEQQRVIAELKVFFDQLRQIPHPRPGTICTAAADDHPLFPYRTPNRDEGAGPFQSEEDFNFFLRSGPSTSWKYGKEENLHNLERCIELQDGTRHQICFTHGDAGARNVMVKKSWSGEYRVTALIDFEMSGFLPEYWEYIAATVPFPNWGPPWWNHEVDKFLTHPTELTMERHRLNYFGAYGS